MFQIGNIQTDYTLTLLLKCINVVRSSSFSRFFRRAQLITTKLLHLKEVQIALEHEVALSSGMHDG